jgi:urease alpha subunit
MRVHRRCRRVARPFRPSSVVRLGAAEDVRQLRFGGRVRRRRRTRLQLRRQVRPVERTRTITKRDLVRNDALPVIEVDPETFAVKADGVYATVPPAESVSLSRLMFFT